MGEPDTGPVPAPTSRAGRNLPAAIASGVVLGALVAVTLFTYKWTFAVLVVVALLIALHEFSRAFALSDIKVARTPIYVAAVAVPASAAIWGLTGQLAATGIVILCVFIWRIRRGYEGYVRDVTASAFLTVYLPFMAGFLMLTLSADDGPQRVVVFILLTISNDIGGYVAGVLFGRHPIAPQISPKKSWEGFAGSVILQCAVGAAAFVFLLDSPWWQGVVVGLVMTITATAGDFAESAIKRDLGVKDMGNFLPGHGGMMDRLDSLIPNAFTSWALFTLFLWQWDQLMPAPGELVFDAPKKGRPPVHLLDLDQTQRRQAVVDLGLPAFRADQVSRQWLSRLSDDPAEWTDVPAGQRSAISDALLPTLLTPVRSIDCDGGTTVKTVWSFHDGALVESVLMRYPGRVTVCISSQAGCG